MVARRTLTTVPAQRSCYALTAAALALLSGALAVGLAQPDENRPLTDIDRRRAVLSLPGNKVASPSPMTGGASNSTGSNTSAAAAMAAAAAGAVKPWVADEARLALRLEELRAMHRGHRFDDNGDGSWRPWPADTLDYDEEVLPNQVASLATPGVWVHVG